MAVLTPSFTGRYKQRGARPSHGRPARAGGSGSFQRFWSRRRAFVQTTAEAKKIFLPKRAFRCESESESRPQNKAPPDPEPSPKKSWGQTTKRLEEIGGVAAPTREVQHVIARPTEDAELTVATDMASYEVIPCPCLESHSS